MYQSVGISVTCASVFATLFVTAFMFVFCVNSFADFVVDLPVQLCMVSVLFVFLKGVVQWLNYQ